MARERVFEAFTDPGQVVKWWGPRGFTTTTRAMKVAAADAWRFTMHGPDGTDFPNRITYREVLRPERLVYLHDADTDDPNDAHRFEVTVTFAAEAERTRLTMRSRFATQAQRDEVAKFAVEGGKSTFDRLEEQLALDAMGPYEGLTLARVVHAPRALVFKVWTDAAHLSKWWGPAGLSMTTVRLELAPGGTYHYGMRTPDGHQMFGKFVYREVVPPTRLAWVSSFSDEKAGITRHPMSKTWPLETASELTLRELDGRTLMLLKGEPVNCTPEERGTFLGNKDGMRQGFAGTFAQLEKYLATLPAS